MFRFALLTIFAQPSSLYTWHVRYRPAGRTNGFRWIGGPRSILCFAARPSIWFAGISAASTVQNVSTRITKKAVVAAFAEQPIAFFVSQERVISRSPADDVVTFKAANPIVSSATQDDIPGRGTAYSVAPGRSEDRGTPPATPRW